MPTYNGPVREERNMATRPYIRARHASFGALSSSRPKIQGSLTGQSSFLNGPCKVFRAEGVGEHRGHHKNCHTQSAWRFRSNVLWIMAAIAIAQKPWMECHLTLRFEAKGKNSDLNEAKHECIRLFAGSFIADDSLVRHIIRSTSRWFYLRYILIKIFFFKTQNYQFLKFCGLSRVRCKKESASVSTKVNFSQGTILN